MEAQSSIMVTWSFWSMHHFSLTLSAKRYTGHDLSACVCVSASAHACVRERASEREREYESASATVRASTCSPPRSQVTRLEVLRLLA